MKRFIKRRLPEILALLGFLSLVGIGLIAQNVHDSGFWINPDYPITKSMLIEYDQWCENNPHYYTWPAIHMYLDTLSNDSTWQSILVDDTTFYRRERTFEGFIEWIKETKRQP